MAQTQWNIDPAHSEIHFKVRHMMITNVTGSFGTFEGNATTEGDDFEGAQIQFIADIASINTNSADRDAHLRSGDFFDAETHPKMTFKSTSMTKSNEDEYTVTGDLTLKGHTKSVTFTAEAGGINKDPWGNTKAGFSLTGKINRKDFDLSWNAVLETGGVMVSEEVKLNAEVQLVKSAS